jgi:transcriptional regulator of nitric oxide reductase
MSRLAAIVALAALLAVPSTGAAQAAAAQGAPSAAVPAPVRQAFPDADRVDTSDVLLTDEMAKRLDDLARSRIAERMVTFYVARKGADVLGYAVLQSHVVRTKRETLLVAFEPDGRIRKIQVVSFLEPPEYKPSDRWLAQFAGKGTGDRLWVGDDVAPISGSTLSARGVSEQARWLLQALRQAREAGKVR